MRSSHERRRALGCLGLLAVLAACAPPKPAPIDPGRVALVPGPERAVPTETTLRLAGSRCVGGGCRCRDSGANEEETSPPADGTKRLEIRMSAAGGVASADFSGLGTFSVSGEKEACAYIDVPAGSTHDVVYVAKETTKGGGIAPWMQIVEYGPKGPFWYDLLAVSCDGPGGRCDRRAADAWGAFVKQRKRGRLEPCGSGVVTKLAWDTAGGQAERDGGLFRDFTVRFTMELKKFATQFAPGSTECVPK